MKQESFTCDVCGTVKGPANHWWLFGIEGGRFAVFGPWDSRISDSELHICGEACATKKLSEFMGRK